MTDVIESSSMLHVSEADVRHLLGFSKAIELVREAYVKLARGEAANPQRVILQVSRGASMYFMPAYVNGQTCVVVKIARVNADNSKVSLPTVLLTIYAYDAITGTQVAEVQGEWLTAVRTAASTAVATDLLAKKNVSVLGVYGSGVQARAHIPALSLVRDFDRVLVYSKTRTRKEEFVEYISGEIELDVEAASSSDQVAEESDVIITATTSSAPVFDGRLVKPGSHVNGIGSAAPDARELDTALIKRSKLVVDSRAQALTTYGDVMKPIKEGAIRESTILELGDLLDGRSELTGRAADITLFKAGGLAVLDAMVTNYIIKTLASQTKL
jgi:ornithine cyclodeaminase/alanine dehydrogenase-like protein (mu-crystallin family)